LQSQPARVGLDPVDRVALMENHDHAFHVWRDAGAKNSVLVHIDAHHDMWWTESVESMTIANFISQALKNDLVREVFWIVPDGTWRTEEGRQAIRSHVGKITRDYPGACKPVREEPDRFSAVLLEKPLTICSVEALPRLSEGVILDIDVDYLVIPRVSYGEVDEHSDAPWCWPAELLARLQAAELQVDLVTVAYSVEGGYTPLEWKYLGDELVLRLRTPSASRAALGMGWMRAGAEAARRGDLVAAEQKYRLAQSAYPRSAWPDYHLARLCQAAGRIEDGRRLYRHAIGKDPSYRSPYDVGFCHYWADRVVAADQAFRRTLTLDPEHAGALLGLGMVAARQRRWADAEALLHRSIEANDTLIDAYRELAFILTRRRAYDEAISAYERSLALALAGYRPLHWLIATEGPAVRLMDADHWKTHARLARLHERKGNVTRAMAGYQISLAAGYGGAPLRRRLARLRQDHRSAAG
jgi:tetratricopeptide (TPR) repeat protein